MNTTYKSQIKPQFDGIQPQDATLDLSQPKQMLSELGKGLEQEAKTLQDIALDEAQISFNRGAAELVDKYGTDFKGLDNAMMKLENESYQKFAQRNPALATKLLKQQDAVRLRAVDAAHKTYISNNNAIIKQGSGMLLEGYKIAMPDDYANYLDTIRKPAEEQDINIKGQWENNLEQIDELLNRRDMNGNYIFDEKTRKQKQFIQDYMLHGAKNMIDRFITANDKAGLQDYYQAHILAPERYMKQTGQDRDTYDKVKKYAEQQLKRMDVEAETLKFKQSVQDAMGLIVENAPEKMAELREANILPKNVLDGIEKNNVRFDTMNAAEPILPTNFLNIADLVASWEANPDARTNEEQIQTMLEANDVLGAIADYGDKYGLSDEEIKAAKNMVQQKATNQAYGELMRTFGDVTNGLGMQISNVQESIMRNREGKDPNVKIKGEVPNIYKPDTSWKFSPTSPVRPMLKSNIAETKYTNLRNIERATAQVRLLDQLLRDAYAQSQQAIETGNLVELPRIQRAVQVQAAHIKYMFNFNDNDWLAWDADKEHEFHDQIGGGIYRIKEITPLGDIITETIR